MAKPREKEREERLRFHLTPGQKLLSQSIWRNDIVVCSGCAGTGKTATTLQTFLDLLAHKHIDSLACVRLITDTFGEHLGALPGEKDEKLLHFLGPIHDNLSLLMKPGELDYFLKHKITVLPVSHVRGRTFRRCGVIIDETQNMTDEMIITIATRIGVGSRMVFCGDPDQCDFRGRNGLAYATQLFQEIPNTDIVYLDNQEVQRHEVIPEILERARHLKATSRKD